MALKKKFVDTVFVDVGNSLDNQIEELNAIKDKVVEKDKIEKDIKLLEYALKGKSDVAFELKNANLGMFVLSDVTLEVDGHKTHIDYVIITRGYTYLVECHNMFGNVVVNNKGEFRREYSYKGKSFRGTIPSPFTECLEHRDIVKKKFGKKSNKLLSFFFEMADDNKFKPLIVFPHTKGVLNVKSAPKKIRNCTIRVDQLVKYIKKDITKYNKEWLSNKRTMYELAKMFIETSIEESISCKDKYTIKKENVKKSKVFNDKEKRALVRRLKELRKELSSKNRIPSYYIFNDKELMDIIDANIKTYNELKESKILSDVKLKLHGKDIISEINRIIDRKRIK